MDFMLSLWDSYFVFNFKTPSFEIDVVVYDGAVLSLAVLKLNCGCFSSLISSSSEDQICWNS